MNEESLKQKLNKFFEIATVEEALLFEKAMEELMFIFENLSEEILKAWLDNYFSKKENK